MSSSNWNPETQLTPAVTKSPVTILTADNPSVDINGPSPCYLVMIVIKNEEGEIKILMARDWDKRKDSNGNLRITYGALKGSIGFGTGEEVITVNLTGPTSEKCMENVDTAMYGTFAPRKDMFKVLPFFYSEGGDGWGPVVTSIWEFVGTGVDLAMFLTDINFKADAKQGRFRNWMLVPIKDLLVKGEASPAVLDSSKLRKVVVDGIEYNLWDENQCMSALLPLLS